MKDLKIQVQYTCPACTGSGVQANPDHNPNDIFPAQMHDTCQLCEGKKTVTEWIDVEHLLKNIAELDIQF